MKKGFGFSAIIKSFLKGPNKTTLKKKKKRKIFISSTIPKKKLIPTSQGEKTNYQRTGT